MAQFSKLTTTNKGKILRSKTQIGRALKFTRAAVGDGYLPESMTLEELDSLISEKAEMDINSLRVEGDGTAVVSTVFTNKNLSEGFFIREIGLFAEDTDGTEILYCVANSGDLADYISKWTGKEIQEALYDFITVIGDTTEVYADINESLVYATKRDVTKIILSKDIPATDSPYVLWLQTVSTVSEDIISAGYNVVFGNITDNMDDKNSRFLFQEI